MIVIKLEKADISREQAKAEVLLSDVRDLVTNQLIQPVLFAPDCRITKWVAGLLIAQAAF